MSSKNDPDKTKRDSLGIGPNALRSVLSDPNAEARQRSLKAQLDADIELRHAIEKRNEVVAQAEREIPGVAEFSAEEMLDRVERRSAHDTIVDLDATPPSDKHKTAPKLGVHGDDLGALKDTASPRRASGARTTTQLVWIGLVTIAAIIVVLVLALRGTGPQNIADSTASTTAKPTADRASAPNPKTTETAAVPASATTTTTSAEPSTGPTVTSTPSPPTTSTTKPTATAPIKSTATATSAYSGWRIEDKP